MTTNGNRARHSCAERGCRLPARSEYHCAACHATFGNLTLFDGHQLIDYTQRPAVTCRPPGRPLVLDAHGCWQTRAGLAARQRSAARLAALR